AEHGLRGTVVPQAREPETGRQQVRNIAEVAPAVVHAGCGDSSNPDGLAATGGFEDSDPSPQARDADPGEAIALLAQFGPGRAGEGGADDGPPRRPRAARDQQGEDPFAGDESQGLHGS